MHIRETTDWYIPEDCPIAATIYPGPVQVSSAVELKDIVEDLLGHCKMAFEDFGKDYRMTYQGISFRGHRQRTIKGWEHVLRRISNCDDRIPDLRSLKIPADIRQILVNANLGSGLVLVCGAGGQGKTTTCSAVVLERVMALGSFCLTVEDPPEFPLHGEYPAATGRTGKIIQVPANEESFAADMRDALRCYPSNMTGSMLLVGEIRDSATAVEVLRAAMDGRLIFATMHASGPIAGIERMLSLCKAEMYAEEAAAQLAYSLRGVVHQTLEHGHMSVAAIFSNTPDSAISARIKAGNLQMLSTELQAQAVLLKNGGLANYILGRNPL